MTQKKTFNVESHARSWHLGEPGRGGAILRHGSARYCGNNATETVAPSRLSTYLGIDILDEIELK